MKLGWLPLFLLLPLLAKAEITCTLQPDGSPLCKEVPIETTPYMNQLESQVHASDLYQHCLTTYVDGRKDADCAYAGANVDMNCAGLNQTIINATSCKVRSGRFGCLEHGAGDYSMEEWFAQGELHLSSVNDCFNSKDNADNNAKSMVGRNDMVGRVEGLTAPDAVGSSSGISGTISSRSEESIAAARNRNPRSRFSYEGEDGSSALGLLPGSLVTRKIAGNESLFEIVSESDFGRRLAPSKLASLQAAMENKEETTAKAKERVAGNKSNKDLQEIVDNNTINPGSISSNSGGVDTSNKSAGSQQQQLGSLTIGPKNPNGSLSIDTAAKTQNVPVAAENRSPANEEKTIFQMVHSQYQKHQKTFLKNNKALSETEAPSFFRQL